MDIKELKKETGLTQKDIAQFFNMTYEVFANSSAKERYENALCKFYSFLREGEKKKPLDTMYVDTSALSDEVVIKILAHCPYEKSGWCTTEIGCRFKLENCDAKGNGCELAL